VRSLRTISLRQLEWVAVLLPLGFLGLYYYLMLGPLHRFFHSWYGFLILWFSLAAAIMVFAHVVFRSFGRMQREIRDLSAWTDRYNRQLVDLHRANLTLSHETRVDRALQAVVDLSAELVGARYAALAVLDDHGAVAQFLTRGIDAATFERIGNLPQGRGLLGALTGGPAERLRLDDLSQHPHSVGFPPGHPPMSRFLGVPVIRRGQPVAALYLADDLTRPTFTAVDEEIVSMFATHAAVVIQNARLYDEVQALAVERERQHIAWEMHDGLAQVLGFVNTKGQAAQEFLRNEDLASARQQLGELVEAARKVYTDIREGIVALRAQAGSAASLHQVVHEYVREFEHFAHIPVEVHWDLEESALQLAPVAEVQLLRIMQESLTNARRHGHPTHIDVSFQRLDDELVLRVQDDGVGFDPSRPTRGEWPQLGLQAMSERADAIGGAIEIESAPRQGTRVTVRVPASVQSPRPGAPVLVADPAGRRP